MEHQHSHRYRKSKNMAGKLITILQLILSAALLILVWNSGMVPNLYLALMGAGLFLLFAIIFFLQYIRNGVRYLGIVISLLISATIIVLQLISGHTILPLVISALLSSFVPAYSSLFLVGIITTISQWKHIHTSTLRKIFFTFTFPFFMFTYVPICVASVFGKVEWKPIEHKVTVSIQQMK